MDIAASAQHQLLTQLHREILWQREEQRLSHSPGCFGNMKGAVGGQRCGLWRPQRAQAALSIIMEVKLK